MKRRRTKSRNTIVTSTGYDVININNTNAEKNRNILRNTEI